MSDVSRECFRVLIDIKYLHACVFMVVRSSQLQILQVFVDYLGGNPLPIRSTGPKRARNPVRNSELGDRNRLNTAATRLLPISGPHQQCLSSCPQRPSWDTHLPSPSRTGLIRSAITTKYPHASGHANVVALTTYQEASHIPSNHLGRMADF